MPDYARRSARVLLLDSAGRLLLLRFPHDPARPDEGHSWFTPGGGVEDGEEVASAAVRELAEETGLRVDPADLRHVAHSSGLVDWDWISGLIRDDYFLCRVAGHEVDTAGLTEFERARYGGHRWWTHTELAATSETVVPACLASLVGDLLAGGPPPAPVELPWE